MTETEARQVLLLQSRETGAPGPHWNLEDRRWATRQATATVGEQATPERFAVARAAIALQRLLPRDASARRWLARRGWHAAWVAMAVVLGVALGLAADQLGPPQRVNLLAPTVWLVVAWNLVVYLALLLPPPTNSFRSALARWGRGDDADAGTLWLNHAAPLLANRAALVLHMAAAALAAGLVSGLYLRGLVLDYRAGWQSTFLAGPQVQWLLDTLLAPASLLTGIAVPDVLPLRVGPATDAVASAAPWIHLYATTLGVFVIAPRLLLAARAGVAAAHRARRFHLPLDTPYFEALHPLMRPGQPRSLRVLWVNLLSRPVRLLGQELLSVSEPTTVLASDEGDELQLCPVPEELGHAVLPVVATTAPTSWWARWTAPRAPAARALEQLSQTTELIIVATPARATRPAWLADVGRPVLVLVDDTDAAPPLLPLQALADGWLPDGRLLQALAQLLPDDPRLLRLQAAWQLRQQAVFDAGTSELARTLARVATVHEAVPEASLLPSRRPDPAAAAAQVALVSSMEAELRAHAGRLAVLLDRPPPAEAADGTHGVPAAAAALHARVGEARAALVGGVLSGALAGLKADLLSGGLTMGAGAVAGGLIGALATAGAARGLNVVRGAGRSYLAWNEEALIPVTEALLVRYLVLAYGLDEADARARLAPALATQRTTLATLWRARQRRYDNEGEADALAGPLQAPLADALRQALAVPQAAAPADAAAA